MQLLWTRTVHIQQFYFNSVVRSSQKMWNHIQLLVPLTIPSGQVAQPARRWLRRCLQHLGHMATSLSLKIPPAASLGVWWLLTGRLRVSCYLAEVGSDWRLRVPTFSYFSMILFAFLGGRVTCILFVSELCTLLVYSCLLHVTIRDSDVVPWFGNRLPVLRLTEGSLATLRRQSEFIDNDVIATSLGWWLVQ